MKITKEQIKALDPCQPGWEWYLKNCKHMTDLQKILLKINKNHPAWSRWLFTHLMNKEQLLEITVFSAEQAINLLKEPDDGKLQKTISAMKEFLNNPSNVTIHAFSNIANSFSVPFRSLAHETAVVFYAFIGDHSEIGCFVRSVVFVTTSIASGDKKRILQERIIKEAVNILERSE